MIACPSCGHQAPDGAAVCPSCGAGLNAPSSPSRRSEERRTVTTLFCDLVGFTALSERNDPEVVDALLRRYYTAARRVVESYGGTVEKFIGDAVVAVFGVPMLHEDDPERAVRAGLRLVDEIDALPGVGGQPLEVRVGVNTGEALVRLDVDPGSGEGFLTGDAVNVAARLQAAAPPASVAVGAVTHAATEKVFSFDACHPVTLKGKSEPLHAWIAKAPLVRTGSELRSFTTSFVGREHELATLQALLDGAASARAPRLGLIVGEPGIGKSRLLAEYSGRLDDQPAFVTWRQGRCLPFGSGVTFWALSEIVKGCAGILESDGVARTEARLETVLPEGEDRDLTRARLRPLLGLEAEEASRDENFAVWRGFLEGLAARGPAVLVVEDLHWADEGMLAFMDYLAASTAEVPLLVLATARPEVLDLSGGGAGFVAAAERLALGPLSGDETAQLVLACLGAKSLPVSLQATLLERSGGNPLFAEELVRLLQDRDLLVNRGGQTVLKEGVELPTPDSIGALIAARLDLLSAERKALLADAAVVGRTFWAGAIAAVGGHDPAAVFEALHELVAKELVRPVRSSSIEGETEFLFVHALVRDVAYGQLTRADRAAKHAALARWLEERTAGRTDDLAEILAYHYSTALEMATACGLDDLEDELGEPTSRYLALAGGRAAPLDSVAAALHFKRAQQVADQAARPKRRWLLSRRTRRTLRRRAPLLAAAAAVIAVAAVAAFAVWAFMPSTGAGPAAAKPLTAAQLANKLGPGVVRITANVPLGVRGKLTWKRIVSAGYVASKDGTIVTSYSAVDRTSRGPTRPPVRITYKFDLVTVELWDADGRYRRVRGFWEGGDPDYGIALISVDPAKVDLSPLPVGDSNLAKVGQQTVCLCRPGFGQDIQAAAGPLQAVWRIDYQATGQKLAVVLRTQAALSHSARGGPMLDANGKVLGIVGPVTNYLDTVQTTETHGPWTFGSAMASDGVASLKGWYDKALYGAQGEAWLGCEWQLVEKPGQLRALGLPQAGRLVGISEPGTPSGRAGIRGGSKVVVYDKAQWATGGDLLLSIDGRPFSQELLGRYKPGDVVTVKVLRGPTYSVTRAVRVRLGTFPYVPPPA